MIPPLLKHPLLAFALRQVALDASANGHSPGTRISFITPCGSLLAELDQRNTLGEHVAKNPESYFLGFESHGVSTSKDYWKRVESYLDASITSGGRERPPAKRSPRNSRKLSEILTKLFSIQRSGRRWTGMTHQRDHRTARGCMICYRVGGYPNRALRCWC